jgi:hypothetical protein
VPRVCTVCSHERISDINAALLRNEAYRAIAKRFGASESAIYRHQQEHLPKALVKATEASEVAQADTLIGKITQLEQEARRLGKKAEDSGDLRAAMAAVRELVRIVELLAKLQGELKEPGGTTLNVIYVNSPGPGKSRRAHVGSEELAPDESGTEAPVKSSIVDVIPDSESK